MWLSSPLRRNKVRNSFLIRFPWDFSISKKQKQTFPSLFLASSDSSSGGISREAAYWRDPIKLNKNRSLVWNLFRFIARHSRARRNQQLKCISHCFIPISFSTLEGFIVQMVHFAGATRFTFRHFARPWLESIKSHRHSVSLFDPSTIAAPDPIRGLAVSWIIHEDFKNFFSEDLY